MMLYLWSIFWLFHHWAAQFDKYISLQELLSGIPNGQLKQWNACLSVLEAGTQITVWGRVAFF